MSGQAGRYQRSTSGLIGAMIVIVVVVGGFVALRAVTRVDPPSPVRDVDYSRVAEVARDQAPFDLVAPPSLPEGWQATNVDFVDGPSGRWHLGMLDAQGRYVGLEQSGSSTASMVESYVDEQAARGTPVDIDGETWTRWSDSGGDVALVRETGGTTTLVVGNDVPVDELVGFIRTLR